MKKIFWPLLTLFALAAAVLRIMNLRTGFEENGLPIAGNLYGYLLPAVLIAAALIFVLLARSYSSQRDETRSMAECFDFSDTLSVLLSVLGAFALMGYAVLSFLTRANLLMMLLSIGYLASAVAFLYAVFQLRRENELLGSVLIAPVCTLVLQLIFTYRSCANDPTLGHTYIEILMVCALMLVFLEFAAFAFRNGAPRLFPPLCAITIILCTCHLVECATLPTWLFAVSFVLLVMALCSAASFEKK